MLVLSSYLDSGGARQPGFRDVSVLPRRNNRAYGTALTAAVASRSFCDDLNILCLGAYLQTWG
jgi:hypothetical protein